MKVVLLVRRISHLFLQSRVSHARRHWEGWAGFRQQDGDVPGLRVAAHCTPKPVTKGKMKGMMLEEEGRTLCTL